MWRDSYGFVHPASGRNLELILPSANADWMGLAVSEFARWADPEGGKRLVVLVGNAGWHVARRLAVPANVVLRRLPACTPELQPAEPLWPLVREAVANEGFDDLEGLQRPLIADFRGREINQASGVGSHDSSGNSAVPPPESLIVYSARNDSIRIKSTFAVS